MKNIQSRDNAFFKSIKRLAESGRERRKTGKLLLDGLHLIESYEAAYGLVETLIIMESAQLHHEIAAYVRDRETVVIADSLMRDLGLVETPSGILAVAHQPAAASMPELTQDAILLDGIQDPGNVGTLLRTAAAVGIKQALLSPGCAAAWSPKVLRASQGAHFLLHIHEEADLHGFMSSFQGTTAVTTLSDSHSLYEAKWSEPLAWVFGAEGQGVRAELIAAAKLKLKIPMPGEIESLNVSAAAAICLFEAFRRKLAGLPDSGKQ